jgi:hypothetical protein
LVCSLVQSESGIAFQTVILCSEDTKSHTTGVDLKQRYGTDGLGGTIGLCHKEYLGSRRALNRVAR